MVVSCKRSLGGDYSNNQISNNRFKNKKDVHPGLNLNWLTGCSAKQLEELVRKVVREEVGQALRVHSHSLTSSSSSSLAVDSGPSVSRRSFRLQLIGCLPSRVFTGNKIEAEGPADGLFVPLKVVLVDANSGALITDGPLSSMRAEAVVLQGDFKAEEQTEWQEKEVNENVVVEREGRRPLLIGDKSITLTKGEALIEGLSFTDNSSWVRSGKFRLAVKAVKGGLLSPDVGVQEAVSGAFEVRDRRGESYQKRRNPSLEDEVWRLNRIAKGGQHAKKLAANGVLNVKDFLRLYYTNPSLLSSILNVSNRVWDSIVSHAKSCLLSNEHYSYFSETEGVGLLFNCVLDLVGVTNDGQTYQPIGTLDKSQKLKLQVEKLRRCAYENRSKLVLIDVPTNWATTMPPEPVFPTAGSSLSLHGLDNVQEDSDQVDADQRDLLQESDLSPSSLPYSYGGEVLEEDEEVEYYHLSEFMGCQGQQSEGAISSLLAADGSLLSDDDYLLSENEQHKYMAMGCSFLGDNNNNNVFQPQTPSLSTWWYPSVDSHPAAGEAGNTSCVASNFSVNFSSVEESNGNGKGCHFIDR